MARVITSLLLIFSTDFFIASFPIKNGFSVKFKQMISKDDYHPKTFGALFTKISQDDTPEAMLRRELLSKTFPGALPELGIGCSNQVVRMIYPFKYTESGENVTVQNTENYYSLPIVNQPFKDYKVLVATAPPDIKIGRGDDRKNVVIYVIFNEDDNNGDSVSVPEVYFVNKVHKTFKEESKERADPVFVVDNNRTVTGLKSKQVEKLLRFRNNLVSRYNYDLSP